MQIWSVFPEMVSYVDTYTVLVHQLYFITINEHELVWPNFFNADEYQLEIISL